MTTPCQNFPRSLAEELLQLVARAICDRPGENAAQRESRTHQMVQSVLGFEPRDGLEYMLATLAVGHFHLVLDSMHDVFHDQPDQLKAKTKTTIVAIDRAMLEMIKELRQMRGRPAVRSAEDAQHGAAIAAPEPMRAPLGNVEVLVPAPISQMPETPGLAAAPETTTDPRQPDSGAATSEPAVSSTPETARAKMAFPDSEPVRLFPLRTAETVPDTAKSATRVAGSVNCEASGRGMSDADLPSWTDEDEAALIVRMAENDVVLAAMKEEARQYDSAKAAAAGGD